MCPSPISHVPFLFDVSAVNTTKHFHRKPMLVRLASAPTLAEHACQMCTVISSLDAVVCPSRTHPWPSMLARLSRFSSNAYPHTPCELLSWVTPHSHTPPDVQHNGTVAQTQNPGANLFTLRTQRPWARPLRAMARRWLRVPAPIDPAYVLCTLGPCPIPESSLSPERRHAWPHWAPLCPPTHLT